MASGLGSSPGIILGVAVGGAAAAALEPAIEVERQDAWQRLPHRVIDVSQLARLVATGGLSQADAHTLAHRHGFPDSQVDALIYASQVTPPVAELLTLWRHGLIQDDLWTHGLVKAGIDRRYYPAMNELKTAALPGIGDVAYAVVRGILPSPDWVPVKPPKEPPGFNAFPQLDLNPVELAA